MYVLKPMLASILGVTRPMMKLHIHVALVVIDIGLERLPRLKISEGRTQPIGANE